MNPLSGPERRRLLAASSKQFVRAQAGGLCALCSATCRSGHYCYGCGEFVCFRHPEPRTWVHESPSAHSRRSR